MHARAQTILFLGGLVVGTLGFWAGGVGGAVRAEQAPTVASFPENLVWPTWAKPPAAGVEPVSVQEARQWVRWVIPLPKRFRLEAKQTVPASELNFQLRGTSSEVAQAAVQRLADRLAEKTGLKQFSGRFSVTVGICDGQGKLGELVLPGGEALAKCPNPDQAYLIVPLAEQGLAVAAGGERGLCYGLKTLEQLLLAYAGPGKVVVPLAAILDWPDLEERGQWGGSSTRDIQYLADRKMNLIEAHSQLSLDAQGRGVARIDAEAFQKARLHGIKWVPIITHLDQLTRTGIYQRYPELKGKGPKAQSSWGKEVFAACFSEPKMAEILADWFTSLASNPGVEDICLWLSESHVQCGCPKCQGKNQYVLEAEACVRAWQLARQKYPKVRLRILLTQGSYAFNDKVLAVAPPEVGITYYDGGRTYDSSRDPMIYPLLEAFARQGRWLGCYPQLTASWRIVCPWSGPQFIKYRMNEFVAKRLRCLCGYATPDNRFYDFNVTAAAEWSWNAQGRSEEEFAAAWAVRRGISDPEKAAQWAVLLGPVGWDVYGSGIPYPHLFSRVGNLVRTPPQLGKGLLRYFPSVEQIAKDLALCDQALQLAQQLQDPVLTAETHVLRGYVGIVRALERIASATAGKKQLDPQTAQAVQTELDRLAAAVREAADNLRCWQQLVAPDCTAPRFADTVRVTEGVIPAVADALKPLGIQPPQ